MLLLTQILQDQIRLKFDGLDQHKQRNLIDIRYVKNNDQLLLLITKIEEKIQITNQITNPLHLNQVAIGIRRKTPQNIDRGSPLRARFKENLKPGRTYQVVVKTVSGSVASWPATGNVTTRPLPVLDTIQTIVDEQTQETLVVWRANSDSYQDGYKVRQASECKQAF